MDGLTSFLDSRASFTVTAFVVTWIGVSLLAVMVISMLVRLRRLELAQVEGAPAPARPYSHVLGRSVLGLLPEGARLVAPGMLVFLSANCRGCAQLLDELTALQNVPPMTLTWLDRAPDTLPALPERVATIPDGAALGRELSIQVTPFAVELDEHGVIVDAKPVNRLEAIGINANGRVATEVA